MLFTRNLISRSSKGKNSLLSWTKVRNPFRTLVNFCVIRAAWYVPSIRLKNFMYGLLGVKVGRDSAFGLGAMLDIFYPELITVGRNSIVGYNTLILTHEFLVGEFRKGPVEIGDDVMIGANCTILAGVKIGNGAIISAMSLVNRDVPAGSFAQGVPIKISKLKKAKARRLRRLG